MSSELDSLLGGIKHEQLQDLDKAIALFKETVDVIIMEKHLRVGIKITKGRLLMYDIPLDDSIEQALSVFPGLARKANKK